MAGAKNLTRLNVALTASIGGFQKGIAAASKTANDFGNNVDRAIRQKFTLIAAAVTGGGLLVGLKQASSRIDELAKSADRLGVSTESLAGLRFAAEQTGASAEILDKGMAKLTKTVQEAAAGNVTAKQTLKELGLQSKDLVGLLPDQQFARVADAVNALDTQGKKTTVTMKLFGDEGLRLLNTFQAGSQGLADMAAQADALGIATSRVDAAKVEEANDALNAASKVVLGIFDNAATRLAPFVTAIAQAFTGAAAQANGFGTALDGVVSFAVKAGMFVADAWQGLGIIWQALRVGVAKVGLGIVQLGDDAARVAQWVGSKFQAAWSLIQSASNTMQHTVGLGWAYLKIPLADFVQFAAGKFAELLELSANAVRRIDLDLAAALDSAAGQVRSSTGALGAGVRKDLEVAHAALAESSAAVVSSTNALFGEVRTTGSETMRDLAEGFRGLVNEEEQALNGLLNQERLSEHFEAVVMTVQNEAQIRAEARAAEIADTQAHQAAMAAAEANGIANRQSGWMDLYNWMQSANGKYTAQTISGFSSMFGNLSKLQDSHSKTARRIGKIAAKQKIVTDTASAAMGAYSSLASIPFIGPALGIAAAAAAVAAGAVQLGNVDKSDSGSIGPGPADTSTGNIGGIATPAAGPSNGQTLLLQGDSFSAESLVKLFGEAQERGITIAGVRRA